MSCPLKYREIGDFHEYYSGARKAPYLTVFVGGNHEASSYLWELFYGGWVAPNIFYMGAANVVRLGPVRIAGMSGIWKGYNYNKPHYERLPYNEDDIKSIYHTRELDVRKLLQIRTQVDIGISHDWPRGIEKCGDERVLFLQKPHFEQESKNGTLGNHAAAYVMDRLRPGYWFSAHMHCKFSATRMYGGGSNPESGVEGISLSSRWGGADAGRLLSGSCEKVLVSNADELNLDIEDDIPSMENGGQLNIAENLIHPAPVINPSTASSVPEDIRAQLPSSFARPAVPIKQLQLSQPCPLAITNKTLRFLALDKCLPGREFIELLEIEPLGSPSRSLASSTEPRFRLQYDPEWLAITRVFASSLILGDRTARSPINLGEEQYGPLIKAEEAWVAEHIVKKDKLTIPENFTITAPVHHPGMPETVREAPQEYNNPQTATFCELVGIENKFFATEEEKARRMSRGPVPVEPRRDIRGKGRGRDGVRGRSGGQSRGGQGRRAGWKAHGR
jgi:lariat debranching enzyme